MGLSFRTLDFAVVALAYGVLALALWRKGRRSLPAGALLGAMAPPAGVGILQSGQVPLWLQRISPSLRDAGWFFLLLVLIRSAASTQKLWRGLAVAALVVIATDAVFNLV